jgi:hypothetical protein
MLDEHKAQAKMKPPGEALPKTEPVRPCEAARLPHEIVHDCLFLLSAITQWELVVSRILWIRYFRLQLQ